MISLKPCPFCGAPAKLSSISGSYGYYSPAVQYRCSKCFCAAPAENTEDWQQGRGTFSVEEQALEKAAAAWNRRAQGLSQEDREHAVKVPRRLVERAMESCQVNNDHEAWYALLWVLDPACIREEMLDRVQDFLRRLGGQTT